mmetsp:Transcript_31782/g.84860  ORF Transcript_31782/g.84860 Transcript_31782/m.84860 type:complete len:350 (-) Transcript_31782:373-1422(-)
MVHSGDAEAVFVRLERRVLVLDAGFGSWSCPGDLGGLPGGKENLEVSKKGSDDMEWAVDPSVTSVRVARSVTILAVSTSKRLTRMISLRSRATSALTLFSSFRKRLRDVSNMESFDACSMTFVEKTSCFFADSSMRLSVVVPASMISAILDSNDHTAGFHWSGSVREVSLPTTSNLDAKCCTSPDNCECHDSTSSSWRSNLVSMSLTVCCQEERSSDKRSNSVFTWIWKFFKAPLKTCTSDEPAEVSASEAPAATAEESSARKCSSDSFNLSATPSVKSDRFVEMLATSSCTLQARPSVKSVSLAIFSPSAFCRSCRCLTLSITACTAQSRFINCVSCCGSPPSFGVPA